MFAVNPLLLAAAPVLIHFYCPQTPAKQQLEVFIEILQCGSTTQAAQSLALSQSAVSAALTDFESQLEVQLFDRVGKR